MQKGHEEHVDFEIDSPDLVKEYNYLQKIDPNINNNYKNNILQITPNKNNSNLFTNTTNQISF